MSPRLEEADRRRLERLLAAHDPADDTERGHLSHVRAFVERHDDPFDPTLAAGHLTGSAFVLDPDMRLLLTHHRKLGIWVQLGGHAEDERVAEEVALREAREESGLADLAFHAGLLLPDGAPRLLDVDVHAIPARGSEPAHEHLDLRFLLVTREPNRVRANPRETRALEWVTLDEARRRCDGGILRALARLERLG